jgi:acyl carrier protein
MYERVLGDVLALMGELAGDWEYEGELTAETGLFGDLGFESLELVILGSSLQERYGQLPFAEFLTMIGLQGKKDVSIGELVRFVCENGHYMAVAERS